MTLSAKKTKDDYFKIDVSVKVGRPRKFKTPNEMALLFNDYVDFVTNNNLEEGVAFHYQGDVTHDKIKKMRPLSLEGFCVFVGTTLDTFKNYESLPTNNKYKAEFLALCTRIRDIVFVQQYEGAAAGLLNHAVVAAKLHLAQVIKQTNINTTPEDITPESVKKINDYLEGKY